MCTNDELKTTKQLHITIEKLIVDRRLPRRSKTLIHVTSKYVLSGNYISEFSSFILFLTA